MLLVLRVLLAVLWLFLQAGGGLGTAALVVHPNKNSANPSSSSSSILSSSSSSSLLLSRRDYNSCFLLSLLSTTGGITALTPVGSAAATTTTTDVTTVTTVTTTATTTATDRNQLLDAIKRQASSDEIIRTIRNLKDPSKNGSDEAQLLSERLDGEWELIWSYGAEAFSPLLTLPKPFRPESYQYFGAAADMEVGEGRIAQGLTGGILSLLFLGNKNLQFWLSSGAIPLVDDPSIFEIQPPFRFQVGGKYQSGQPKWTWIEAGSDAEFRKVNARSLSAQQAGKNLYQQWYVENNGPGSIRVSSVIAGDPVLVGEIFVHRKR